jgi:hypothetical protein
VVSGHFPRPTSPELTPAEILSLETKRAGRKIGGNGFSGAALCSHMVTLSADSSQGVRYLIESRDPVFPAACNFAP